MHTKVFFVLVVVGIALVVPALSAEKCYQCIHFDYNKTTTEDNCKKTPPAEEFLKNCSESWPEGTQQPKDWQCVLVRGRIEVDEENYDVTYRDCVPGKLLKTECKSTKSYEIVYKNMSYGFVKKGSECVCDDKDGCNSAASLTFGLFTLALCLFMSVF